MNMRIKERLQTTSEEELESGISKQELDFQRGTINFQVDSISLCK